METKSDYITRVRAHNFKKIRTIDVEFSGRGVVKIAGRNEQGKSSFIDAIQSLFDNRGVSVSKPIRDGEESAEVVCETESGLVIRRKWSSVGTRLEVTTKQGASFKSPQKMLDELVGNLSFDPTAFARMKESDQSATLRELIGIDTTDLDKRRELEYDHRRDVNREVKRLEALLSGLPYNEVEGGPVTVSSLIEELNAVQEFNRAVDGVENEVVAAANAKRSAEGRVDNAKENVTELERQMSELRGRLKNAYDQIQEAEDGVKAAEVDLAAVRKKLSAAEKKDDSVIRGKIDNAEAINTRCRENAEHERVKGELESSRAEWANHDAAVSKIDKERDKMIRSATFPIKGLGFSDSGIVTFNGIPFVDCSSAQTIHVSTAMAMAMQPNLKVILIRDGSLLDDEHLAIVEALAEEKGFQVFLELVSNSPIGSTLYLVDGQLDQPLTNGAV